eukprot:m.22835 g.22835  ORF g.22835 m.22835 type:complete len:571 (+) comp5871_c0_seq1:364-2076(+)
MLKRIRNSFKGRKDEPPPANGAGAAWPQQRMAGPGAVGKGTPRDVRSILMARAIARRSSVSNFLTAPITEVTTSSGSGCGLEYGEACMQGWRSHMEDAYIGVTDIPGLEGWSFFAVLDGHAGKEVALHSAKTLTDVCAEFVTPVRFSPRGCMDGLRRAFLKHDKNLESDFNILKDQSGATCTSVLIGPSQIVFANIGDSRSLLSRGGKVIVATVDHKPTDSKEHARITDAGGKVLNGRVDGGLALSRAFGDFEYKMRSDLPPVRQKVSAEPDCIYVHRRPGHDEFVLLACDGLWDVSSNEQVATFVRKCLAAKPRQSPAQICGQLVKIALDRGSRDNVSALLVVLPKNKPPEQGDASSPVKKMVLREDVAAQCALSSVVYATRTGVDLACAHIRVMRIRQRERQAAARRAAQAQTGKAEHPPKSTIERKSSFGASIASLNQLPINMAASKRPGLQSPVEVDEVSAEENTAVSGVSESAAEDGVHSESASSETSAGENGTINEQADTGLNQASPQTSPQSTQPDAEADSSTMHDGQDSIEGGQPDLAHVDSETTPASPPNVLEGVTQATLC